MEETTTSTPADDSAVKTATAAIAVTDEAVEEQAVETQESQDTSSPQEKEQPESGSEDEGDDDLKWAQSKNIPLDDPAKIAKMLREGERKITQTAQEANELKKSVGTASEGLDDIEQLRNKVAVMDFYQTYPDARGLDADMAKVLDEKPYFANDLEGLYFYTKGLQADKGLVEAKKAGSKEALAAAASKERGGAPKASATVRETPKVLTNEDIKNMSLDEYRQAKADGKIDPYGEIPN